MNISSTDYSPLEKYNMLWNLSNYLEETGKLPPHYSSICALGPNMDILVQFVIEASTPGQDRIYLTVEESEDYDAAREACEALGFGFVPAEDHHKDFSLDFSIPRPQ